MASASKSSKRLGCTKCDKTYKSKDTLRKHLRLHDPIYMAQNKDKLSCSVCEKLFSTAFCVNKHYRTQHGPGNLSQHKTCRRRSWSKSNNKWECTACGRTYSNKYALAGHQKLHDPIYMVEKRHELSCSICDRLFPRSSTANKHYRQYHAPGATKVVPTPTRRTGLMDRLFGKPCCSLCNQPLYMCIDWSVYDPQYSGFRCEGQCQELVHFRCSTVPLPFDEVLQVLTEPEDKKKAAEGFITFFNSPTNRISHYCPTCVNSIDQAEVSDQQQHVAKTDKESCKSSESLKDESTISFASSTTINNSEFATDEYQNVSYKEEEDVKNESFMTLITTAPSPSGVNSTDQAGVTDRDQQINTLKSRTDKERCDSSESMKDDESTSSFTSFTSSNKSYISTDGDENSSSEEEDMHIKNEPSMTLLKIEDL